MVLPVLNEARDLGRLLDELRTQTVPAGGVEVLVVDGGSTDGTRELVRNRMARWDALKLLDNPRRRSGPGRNVGMAAARGELVVFLDGHCSLPRRDYLLRVVDLFAESGADCLSRPQPLTDLVGGMWERAVALARHSLLGHNPGSDIYRTAPGFTDPESAGAAYRRGVLWKLGGYDERFDACEDVEFNVRVKQAGFRTYRHPDLAVAYRPRSSLSALFRQMAGYGRGRARVFARHPSSPPWALLVLTGLALGVMVWAVVAGIEAGVTVALGVLVFWWLACAAEGMRLADSTAEGVRVALALIVVHAGLLLGFWRGLPEVFAFRRPRLHGSGIAVPAEEGEEEGQSGA